MSSTSLIRIEKILRLASQIEEDINSRKLKAGDRYFDTNHVARMLGCDTTDANRALQLLVKRNVVERRQRVGTRIARTDSPMVARQVTKVRVLVFGGAYLDRAVLDSGALFGLHSALPGVQVQIELVPGGDDEEPKFMQHLVGQSLQTSEREGFVLLNSSLVMQRLMAASGLPAVVWGHPFPSVTALPYVDRDMDQLGRLISKYALSRGCRWFLLLMNDQPRAGDYKLCDAVRDTLHVAGIPAPSLTMRSVSPDPSIVSTVVKDFLNEAGVGHRNVGPAAVLAQNQIMGDAAVDAVEEVGLVPQEQVNLVVANYFHSGGTRLPYAIAQPEASFQEQGVAIGAMLSKLAAGKKPDPDHFLFHVKLQESLGDVWSYSPFAKISMSEKR